MKQSKKLVLLVSTIFILGIIAYWLLSISPNEKAANKVLKQIDTANIAKVTIHQDNLSFSVARKNSSYTTSTFAQINIPIHTTNCNTLFTKAGKIEYSEIINELGNNKEDYGLNNPLYSFTVTSVDQNTYTVSVGTNYYKGDGVYFSISGDNKVYGIHNTDYFKFLEQREDTYVEKVIFPKTKGSAFIDLKQISWEKDGVSYQVKNTAKDNQPAFSFIKPTKLTLDEETTKDLFYPLLQLHATSVYKPKLTTKEKERLGFSNNKVSFQMELNNKTQEFKFLVGNKTQAGYYLLAPNGVCYLVPSTSLVFFEHQLT